MLRSVTEHDRPDVRERERSGTVGGSIKRFIHRSFRRSAKTLLTRDSSASTSTVSRCGGSHVCVVGTRANNRTRRRV